MGTVSLAGAIEAGDRRALAKGITLIESSRNDHRERAARLLSALPAPRVPALRVALSGAPGVGKSTFIEALGLQAIGRGRRIAVLSVDPSSRLSGGSILGDKTRMEALSRKPEAYIRPSPAGTTLGGVARRTREAILLCEAAGFDLIIVETVGVGQSEVRAAEMTDVFLLLLLPFGGDELQGIKRGIMELADIVVVNKADGGQRPAALRTVAEYRNALRLLRPHTPGWCPVVEACSALTGEGIESVWGHLLAHRRVVEIGGELEQRRRGQSVSWLWEELSEQLMAWLDQEAGIRVPVGEYEALVAEGRLAPPVAARRILSEVLARAVRSVPGREGEAPGPALHSDPARAPGGGETS